MARRLVMAAVFFILFLELRSGAEAGGLGPGDRQGRTAEREGRAGSPEGTAFQSRTSRGISVGHPEGPASAKGEFSGGQGYR